MAEVTYLDLAEFGLALIAPSHPTFPGLVSQIEALPQPFPAPPPGELRTAAVVLNQSGQAIVAFVTPVEGTNTDTLEHELRDHVADRIGKLARPKRIIWSEDLPKTRSGKIMRRLLRDIAEGRALGDVTTLRDPTIMATLSQRIAERGDDEE